MYGKSLYPSSRFWKTYHRRFKKASFPTGSVLSAENRLCLLHNHFFDGRMIECGEIDGIVSDSWTNIDESSFTLEEEDENDDHVGYWAAAAVWFDAWDQTTVDRVSCFSFFCGVLMMLFKFSIEC